MRALQVLAPGLFTTLQDGGRRGLEDRGVPPSGAMDEMSFATANALVGNPPGTGALEFTLIGAELRVGQGGCCIAVTGDMQVFIDDQPAEPYRLHALCSGSVVRVGRALSGSRGYLAVAGGFAVQPVMNSVATLVRAGLGGFAGRALAKGDRLALLPSEPVRAPSSGRPAQRFLPQRERQPIRIVLGPQEDFFAPDAIASFLGGTWRVTPDSDRMGYRLGGTAIEHSRGFNIVSDAISTGSIQIPGNGQPIIAMQDRQTTGGYPKIATVIRADLARLGQLKPGDRLRFETIEVEAAETLWVERQALFARYLDDLRQG